MSRLFDDLDREPEDQEAENLRAGWRREKEEGADMINAGLCTCGHDQEEHVHRCAECTACDCGVFAAQDDLDRELNDASA